MMHDQEKSDCARRSLVQGERRSRCLQKPEVETQWVQAPHGQSLASRPKSESWGSSRQGCVSRGVKVSLSSVARNGRLAYPGHEEVTNREMLGCKSHGCSVRIALR
jgi:hypothetical protein